MYRPEAMADNRSSTCVTDTKYLVFQCSAENAPVVILVTRHCYACYTINYSRRYRRPSCLLSLYGLERAEQDEGVPSRWTSYHVFNLQAITMLRSVFFLLIGISLTESTNQK